MARTPTTEDDMQPDLHQRLLQTFESLGLHPLTAVDLVESLSEDREAVMALRSLTGELILDPDFDPPEDQGLQGHDY